VDSVFLVGAAVPCDGVRWSAARSVVAGDFCNGYKPDDAVLGLLVRANELSVGSLAGLEAVRVAGVKNFDYSAMCAGRAGHGQLREKAEYVVAAMREAAWSATGDM